MFKSIWSKIFTRVKKIFDKKILTGILAVLITVSVTMGGIYLFYNLNGGNTEGKSLSFILKDLFSNNRTVSTSVDSKASDFVKGTEKGAMNGTGKYVTKDGEVVDDDLVVGGSTTPEDGSRYYSPDFISTQGDLILNRYFTDNMLFQQERPIVVWGKEKSGQVVKVKLARDRDKMVISQNKITAENGEFYVRLPKVKGSFETYTLIIEGSCNKKINNILIGELWIAGGQSNMELPVKMTSDSSELLNGATNPNLRFFQEIRSEADNNDYPKLPEFDVAQQFSWGMGNNRDFVCEMSAIGYVFSKELFNKLNVPVGVIDVAVGGTNIEAWISRDGIEEDNLIYNYLKGKKRYFAEEEINKNTSSKNTQMTVQYNKRISPIKKTNVKGVIWYQGEGNATDCFSSYYTDALRVLTKEWSKGFGSTSKQLPFILVNIAPYNYGNGYVTLLNERIADLYKDNTKSFSLVPIYDISLNYLPETSPSPMPAAPIHPVVKTTVGERCAEAAMGVAYGSTKEYMTPVFTTAETSGNKMRLKFTHVGSGLSIKNNEPELLGFAIAGSSGKFVPANAKIIAKDTVEISSEYVKSPKYATYGFTDYNMDANLVNSIGIPATPFRSEKKNEFIYYRSKSWTYLKDLTVWTNKNSYQTAWSAATEAQPRITGLTADKGQEIKDNFALKISYNSVNTSPILIGINNEDVLNLQAQYTPYSKLTFTVYNPDNREKSFKRLQVKGDGRTLYAGTATTIPANGKVTVSVDMWSLKDKNGNQISEITSILNSLQALNFEFNDNYQGNLFIHSILFRT